MKNSLLILTLLVCPMITFSQNCIDLDPYDELYLNDVSSDDVTYPIGDPFITTGDISYVKPSSGNFYQFINGDSLLYVGDIDIDVSASNCTNKSLTFRSSYTLGIVIDGDTVMTQMNPNAYYNSGTWEFQMISFTTIKVTGDFDVVHIISSTNYLFDVCLECLSLDNTGDSHCMSLSSYHDNYLYEVSLDDVTYPVGDPFIVHGYIHYVKPSSGNMYQYIMGDSLIYIGDISIDVSTAPCTSKSLTFSSVYTEGLVVDGDTVFSAINPPTYYNGGSWELNYTAPDNYHIIGDFDVVHLISQTNFLYNVCLACESVTANTNELEAERFDVEVYPNPTNGEFYIQNPSEDYLTYQIYNSSGQLVKSGDINGTQVFIDLSDKPKGMYLIRIMNNDDFHISRKLIRN
ncbi:MAG: T9SS type A sorting domain-containing protein [Crocinitomicaceae bacterium]|nr:T9SS type A sorting domain-containing protein [Crocinitomicaceae bacterium]